MTDEAIEVLRALWTMEKPSYEGRFFSFAGIDAQPRPVQKPYPPIVVGGRTRYGARRAARYGNGWYGFNTDLEMTNRCIGLIRDYIANGERSTLTSAIWRSRLLQRSGLPGIQFVSMRISGFTASYHGSMRQRSMTPCGLWTSSAPYRQIDQPIELAARRHPE